MEVRKGYKQTEVGVIPEEWDIRTLDSLGQKNRPAIKAGPFGSSLTKATYVADGYKVYGQEQVIRNDYLYGDYFISRERFNELKSCAVEPGDILLSLVGTAGRILIIPKGAPEGIINPRLIRFSFDENVISSQFFKYQFESDIYQSLLKRTAQGGTMGVLNAGLLKPICIPVPTLAEQEAISEALSDADALIESLETLLAKKRQVKQGAMSELLTGKKRLVESGKWKVKRLGDECELITKGTTPTSIGKDFTSSGVKFIKIESLTEDGEIIDDKVAFIDEETHKLLKRSQLREGDLLISIAGALGRTGIVEKNLLPANTNQALAIARLKSNAQLNLAYIYQYLKLEVIKKHIEGISVQGAQANLSLQNIADLPIYAPNLPEQTAIAEILSDMDAEIRAVEEKLSKARGVKAGMMSELLTGRIRLNHD